MLNEAVLNHCSEAIVENYQGCYAVNSFAWEIEFSPTPKLKNQSTAVPISVIRLAIVPIHLSMHWSTFIVTIDSHDIKVCIYEPLCRDMYNGYIEDKYNDHLLSFLRQWYVQKPTGDSCSHVQRMLVKTRARVFFSKSFEVFFSLR